MYVLYKNPILKLSLRSLSIENKEDRMSIPSYLYNPKIISLIEDNISDGYASYDALTEFERANLAVAAMDALGEDAYEAITEHDDLRIVIHHLKMFMKTAKPEYASDLAETMVKNAIEHFEPSLTNLYAEIYDHSHLYSKNYGDVA